MLKKSQTGFTLIEMVVTVAVGAILIGVALPEFSNLSRSNNMTTTVNDLVHALRITRSEALKSSRASICVSSDQATCTGGAWTQGWIVFADFNGDCVVDPGENVIRAREKLPAIFKVGKIGGASCVTFSGEGFITPPGIATFQFCDDRTGPNAGRIISVIRSGRPAAGVYGGCPTV